MGKLFDFACSGVGGFIVAIFIMIAIVLCPFSTTMGQGLFSSPQDTSPPVVNSQYVDKDGDGFVPAAGDPLYDEHYGKNVNGPNSEAKRTLAEAGKIDAEAADIRATINMKEALLNIVFVVGILLLFVIVIGSISRR